MAEVKLEHGTAAPGATTLAGGPALAPPRLVAALLLHGLEAATILVMVAEVAIITTAIVFRYVVNRPIGGSDEIATLLLVWLTFLGGALASANARAM